MINKTGLDRIVALLDDDVTHIAVGTGAAPGYTATDLTAEAYRAAISDTFIDGLTLVKELFLDESQANVTIKEVGIFDNGATNTANSGELFASFATNLVKTNTQSLTISFEIEVLEVL